MAFSKEYLAKIRFAVRRSESEQFDSELSDVMNACRADMIRVGVPEKVADDEQNPLVLGCQRAYARWQVGGGGNDPQLSKEDYRLMLDELRKMDYTEESHE